MPSAMVYLTRHGETKWNLEGRFQGWQDSPLSARGVAQAQRLAISRRDAALDAVSASPSGRTMRTAEIARGVKNAPIIPVPALREISGGPWEGMTRAEAQAAYPEQHARYRCDPRGYRPPEGGESFHAETDPRQHRRAVARTGVGTAMPAGLTQVEIEGGRQTILRCADTSHWEGMDGAFRANAGEGHP